MKRVSRSTLRGWRRFGTETRRFEKYLNHKPALVYSVVADIDKYSHFLPWCKQSKVISRLEEHVVLAELTIGFLGIAEERFTSKVVFEPVRSVICTSSRDIDSISPLKALRNEWTFEPSGETQTRVCADLTFEFENPIYAQLSSHFLGRISNMAIAAFSQRCDEYAKSIEEEQRHEEGVFIQESFEALALCSYLREDEVELVAHKLVNLSKGMTEVSRELFGTWLGREADRATANYVFESIDKDSSGGLTLREFVVGVSTIARGSSNEKISFWFRDRQGRDITRSEVERAVRATKLVQRALRKSLVRTSAQFPPSERAEAAAVRLVAPVFRKGSFNQKAFDRLFSTI